jgi:hypothetical protein
VLLFVERRVFLLCLQPDPAVSSLRICLGHRWALSPISVTQSDIRDQRYRTEPDIGTSDIGLKSAESDIISDIGINFCPISDIRRQNL